MAVAVLDGLRALLLPTRNGTCHDRTGAGSSIIKPLVDETNAVLAEREQPALREAVTAHALRKTCDLERYLAMTADRPSDGPLLPTRRGTFHNRNNAAKRVVAPLVAETNTVLGERGQPKLREGITAHALRKTYFTFLHEAGAPPRWIADQGGHSDPSTSLRIYTESLRDRERRQHGAAFDALLNGTRQNGRGETG